MIRQYPEDTVVHFFLAHLLPALGHSCSILLARHLLNFRKDRGKQITRIVGWVFFEILEPVRYGKYPSYPLQSHARVHMTLR